MVGVLADRNHQVGARWVFERYTLGQCIRVESDGIFARASDGDAKIAIFVCCGSPDVVDGELNTFDKDLCARGIGVLQGANDTQIFLHGFHQRRTLPSASN